MLALSFAAVAAGPAPAAPSKCPVVPFGEIAGTIGHLKYPGTGYQFQPWGEKPKAGIQQCQATSSTAKVGINAWCRVPQVATLFYQYAHGIAKPRGQQWQEIHGLGDQAFYILDTVPDKILGKFAGLSVRKGKTMYQVTGAVGDPKRVSTLKPMPKPTLIELARKALGYKCP